MKGPVESVPIDEGPGLRSERAYQRLRREIILGELMPGERLRAADLQERFGLGLTPIREALTRLSVEGMVEGESHRGPRVPGLSQDGLADLFATRRDVERLCLTRALAAGDALWEAGIVAAFHLLSRTPLPLSGEERDGVAAWERHHRAFHLSLVSACGSEWLMRFWTTLVDHSERYRKLRLLTLGVEPMVADRVARDHERLMEAALARDVDEACRRMDQHLADTEAAVAALLTRDGAGAGAAASGSG
jgi:GntR family transcriptional regulator, carbon starvation induced regulator